MAAVRALRIKKRAEAYATLQLDGAGTSTYQPAALRIVPDGYDVDNRVAPDDGDRGRDAAHQIGQRSSSSGDLGLGSAIHGTPAFLVAGGAVQNALPGPDSSEAGERVISAAATATGDSPPSFSPSIPPRARDDAKAGEEGGELKVKRKPTFKSMATSVKMVNRMKGNAKMVLPFDRHAGVETVFDSDVDASIDIQAAEARPERRGSIARQIELRIFYERLNVQLTVAALIFLSFLVNMAEAQVRSGKRREIATKTI